MDLRENVELFASECEQIASLVGLSPTATMPEVIDAVGEMVSELLREREIRDARERWMDGQRVRAQQLAERARIIEEERDALRVEVDSLQSQIAACDGWKRLACGRGDAIAAMRVRVEAWERFGVAADGVMKWIASTPCQCDPLGQPEPCAGCQARDALAILDEGGDDDRT